MVGVVSGAGVGLERSSAQILGGFGLLGNPLLGRVSDNVYLNAATGNLVVQRQDEFLTGRGPDSAISRTYNSLGNMPGETDNWTLNVQRKVTGLTGTVNTAGSTATRTGADGTQITYYWVASLSAYMTREGSGASDTLTFSGSTWTWTDGTSRVTETYDHGNGGRITSSNDTEGNSLAYTYNGSGQLYRVTTADGDYTEFIYTGANLTKLTTVSGGVTTNRTLYEYDNENRLIKVTIDKSPTDNSITDGATYVTNYTYISGTKLVNQVWSDTGQYLGIIYGHVGGQYRVSELRESVNGVMRYTTFSYDLVNRTTTIRNQQGATAQAGDLITQLGYDTGGQLTSVTASGRTQSFTYDGAGNVTSMTDGGGHTTTYGYDNNDNRVWQRDHAGNQINWSYGSKNELLTETRFLTPDPDGAGAGVASNAVTTNYIYFNGTRLAFVVSPEGRVTWYGYDAYGQVSSVVEYTESAYTGALNYSALAAWNPGPAGGTKTTRTDTTYDARGNVATVTSYAKVLTSLHGDSSSEISKTHYTYSQTGQLLSRRIEGNAATETFIYDGLGRMIGSTDFLGQTTSFAITDGTSNTQVIVTLANGSTTTSVYNKAGELLTTAIAGSGVTTATTTYKHDVFGRLRVVIDPVGNKSHVLYDAASRKVADIAADGGIVEYIYNNDDLVIATVAYANKLSLTTLASLVDASNNPLSVALSSVRPSAHANDRWSWNVYDAADRLIQTIDGAGTATNFVYDGASQLVSTKTFANALSVAGYKTTPPTTQQLPTAHANDRTTRSFYSSDGLLVGVLDAAGYLTQQIYDKAGHKTETIAYANVTNSAHWASGSLANLLSGLASPTTDVRTRYVYDSRSLLRGTIDATGAVTTVAYDTAGRVTKAVQHATLYTASTVPTFSELQTWATGAASANDRITRTVYDAAGQPVYVVDAEGFVTKKEYDFAGRVTKDIRYAVAVSASDGMTPASMAALLPGTIPTTAAVTTYAYDSVGRLTDLTDAEGTVTRSVYNVLGQVTDVTVAHGTGDAATTQYTYDVVGQVQSETRGYGTSDASTLVYLYDAFGQVTSTIDGNSFETFRTYDAVGRLLTVSVPLEGSARAVTTSQYDAFGNLVKLTDPRGNPAYYYYDKLGRQTLQIDPEGYATQTTYSVHGEIATVKRYHIKTTGAAVATAPTLYTHANDATTSFTRDRLGRVIATTDAQGFTESYTINAFGNRVSLTNKVGGVTTYTYDKRGLLTYEVLPITTSTGAVIKNAYGYDARGNRIYSLEAHTLAEQRGTSFVYDKLNRLVAEGGNDIYTVDTNFQDLPLITPTEYIQYDRRGNIVKTTNASGVATWRWYDDLGRKVAQVDGTGTLSTWTYDLNGNVLTARVWETPVASPSLTTVPTGSGGYRETTYAYDGNNRRIWSSVAGLRVGSYTSGYQTSANQTVWTYTTYDANGNVVEEIDGEGNSAYHYYDKLGRKTASVDREGYVTTYALDAEGNVLTEHRYANKTGSANAAAFTNPTASTDDRVTTFTYDKNGRRLTETRTGVVAYTVNTTTGALEAASTSATIAYAYNGLGQVTRKIEATGNAASINVAGYTGGTDYVYDLGGRLTYSQGPELTAYTGTSTTASVRRKTDFLYDGLNNVTRERVTDANGATADVRATYYTYGRQGRLETMTDANGFVRTYGYDREGNLIREKYTRTKSDGSTVTEANVFRYDALHRQIFQAKATLSGSTWVVGDSQQIQYNRFGEISAKGINGLWQEALEYDKGGRLVKTTAGDGTIRFFVHDQDGAVTLTISSTGTDLAGYTVDTALSALGTIGSTYNAGITATVSVYDKLGQNTASIEAQRKLTAGGGATNLNSSKTYNAFGEVTAETNTRGHTTNFTYNTLGKLIEKKNPTVSVTAENGAVSSVRPTETYYYDLSGRLVGIDDANGNRTTRQFLGGSGYGGEEPVVTAEHHADGGVKRTGYDLFGNARKLTNEIGKVEYRTYDNMSRLLTITRPGGLLESYAYDQLGQRTQHWNSQFGSGFKELTDYDLQGRISRTADYEGGIITYAYAWNGSLTTSGLGTFGGWTKTTSQYGAYTATESTDIFGRTIGKSDFGGITYGYTYNKAGWLTLQTSSEGQHLTYTYLNTGAVSTITDASQSGVGLTSLTTYTYDEAGNKLTESFSATRYGVTTAFQSATAVYDGMNRRTSIADTARGGRTSTYKYDAVGNVRQGEGLWYKYDAMNRVVRQGHFVGTAGSGTIERGTDMLYDAAGQRVRVITTGMVTEHVTNWWVPQVWVPTQTYGGYYEYGPFMIDLNDPDLEYFYYDGNYYDEWARDGDGNEGMYQFYNGQWGYWCMQGERWVEEWTIPGHYEGGYSYTGNHTAPTDKIEIFTYNDDGYLTSVSRAHKHLQGGGESTPTTWSYDIRDSLGRVTEHFEYYTEAVPSLAGSPSYRETNTYDKRSNLLSKWTGKAGGGSTPFRYSETTFSYLKMEQGAWGLWFPTGSYQGGAVTGTVTKSWEANSWTLATKNNLNSNHFNVSDSSTRNLLEWRDNARIAYEYTNIGGSTYTSTHAYDKNGYLTSVAVADGAPLTKYFLTDARGQLLQRKTRSTASPGASGLVYFQSPPSGGGFWGSDQTVFRFDGYFYGEAETGSYQQGINDRGSTYRTPERQSFFVTPQSQPSASMSHTVRAGETLASIAGQIWGDASLWYVIAEANGLSGSGQIAAGQTLIVPNKAVRKHYSADTMRPYDSAEIIGHTGAAKPRVDKKGDCGVAGQILKMIVAVAVTALLPGGNFLVSAFNAAVGNIASQGFAMATGIQDSFSWKEVGMSAISGGVSKGLKHFGGFNELGGFGQGVVSNAVSQGIGKITGLQDHFDFLGVGVAGIMSGVAGSMYASMDGVKSDVLRLGVSNMAGALAAAGARTIVEGSSFGDNLKSLLPSVIGNTVGGVIERHQAAQSAFSADQVGRDAAAYVSDMAMGASYGLVSPSQGASAQSMVLSDTVVEDFVVWGRKPLNFLQRAYRGLTTAAGALARGGSWLENKITFAIDNAPTPLKFFASVADKLGYEKSAKAMRATDAGIRAFTKTPVSAVSGLAGLAYNFSLVGGLVAGGDALGWARDPDAPTPIPTLRGVGQIGMNVGYYGADVLAGNANPLTDGLDFLHGRYVEPFESGNWTLGAERLGSLFGDTALTLVPAGIVGKVGRGGKVIAAETAGRGASVDARGGAYLLRDAEGNVVRTGRTNDLARRQAEHARDPALGGYDFEPAYRTDNYAQQRGLEDYLHNQYNPPLNRIRPISPTNPRLPTYQDAANEYLRLYGGQ